MGIMADRPSTKYCSICTHIDLSKKTPGGITIPRCGHKEVKTKTNPIDTVNRNHDCEYWEWDLDE